MVLNFPSSPATGAIHNASNGLAYAFDGVKWTSQGSYNTGTVNVLKIDSIASSFNGSLKTFDLKVNNVTVKPVNDQAVLISVNNVVLEPTVAYQINAGAGQITFTTAPTGGHAFFGILYSRIPVTDTVSNPVQLSNGDKGDITIANAGELNEAYTIDANAITTAKIADDAVTSAKIADNAITAAHIAPDTIIAADIAANAIGSSELADNAVDTAAIAPDAVTGAKIADDQINSEHYVDGSIDTAHIADNAVTGAKIADNLDIPDKNKIRFGTGNDLEIYHDSINSYIKDAGTGILRLTSNQVQVTNAAASEVLANFIEDGTVELYYDNVKKFETTSTGIKVTGDASTGTIIQGAFSLRDTTSSSDRIKWIPNSPYVLRWSDSFKASFGSGDDLSIYHDGTNSLITNTTGDLEITSTGDDVIIKSADDIFLKTQGSEAAVDIYGNGGVFLYYDAVKKFETTSTGVSVTGQISQFETGGNNKFTSKRTGAAGSNNDTFFEFKSLNTADQEIGSFLFQRESAADDSYFILKTRNTGGSNTERFRVTSTGNLQIPNDSGKLQLGSSQDLELYHDGTNSFIKNTGALKVPTGSFKVKNAADDEAMIIALQNNQVELYYDGSKKFETLTDGVNVTGTLKINGSAITTGGLGNVVEDTTPQLGGDLQSNGNDIDFADNDKAIFGTGGDLSIYHDGDNNYIDGNSAAEDNIYIRANVGSDHSSNIHLQAKAGEESIVCRDDEQVELYYDGSQKFKTTSFGCTVQGGITFGSDTAAANQMDDYEEGVFTPSLEFGGATTGITYASMRGGSYTKIGRQVTVNFGFTLTSKGSASGDATIAGLPFAIEDLLSSTTAEASGVSSFWNDIATNSANIVFVAMGGTSELEIRNTVGAEDDTDTVVDGDFENNTAIRGSITYFTAT